MRKLNCVAWNRLPIPDDSASIIRTIENAFHDDIGSGTAISKAVLRISPCPSLFLRSPTVTEPLPLST
ncbi:hypothetical protein HETIRDRAFT_316639 [Heterobasidion irregulare TC 32-1]|uniref:Uncharacterized protein n=1 Tax=Heterobasidion irregulare (strain TC 32-1) TaxID=747525 RepID=W4KBT7_HETIT|nr:uncharacterized protein HETIRDRAFT_316639 [Heterobasidion irregulare TC 32-1]ETW82541.1 hypothetical protein HETIRDRAFT_316639 [Heterobasidion irregulare TC 32-1]